LTIIKRRQRQPTTFFLPNLEKEEAGAATGTFKYILRQWNDAYTAWIDPFTYDSSTGNVIFWYAMAPFTAGNVGIGTTTPAQKLSISSGSLDFYNFGFASSYRGQANNFTNLFLGGSLVDNGNGSYIVQTDGGSN